MTDKTVEAVATAIFENVPSGYGMAFEEARQYAKAAISAHLAALIEQGPELAKWLSIQASKSDDQARSLEETARGLEDEEGRNWSFKMAGLAADSAEDFRQAAAALAAMREVCEAAKLFRDEGTILTACDRGPCQRVIENADKSDPQARLFEALARLPEGALR